MGFGEFCNAISKFCTIKKKGSVVQDGTISIKGKGFKRSGGSTNINERMILDEFGEEPTQKYDYASISGGLKKISTDLVTPPPSPSFFRTNSGLVERDASGALLEVQQERYREAIVESMRFIQFRAMRIEGIFRIAGRQTNLERLYKAAIGSKEGQVGSRFQLDLNDETISVHDVSGLLKKLLRTYPGGLIPQDILCGIIKEEHQRQEQRLALSTSEWLHMLPWRNQFILRALFALLSNMAADYVQETRMDINALAIVMAPNLGPYDVDLYGNIIFVNNMEKSIADGFEIANSQANWFKTSIQGVIPHSDSVISLRRAYELMQYVTERLIQRGIEDPCLWL
jgi:hypothetical protein